jgi:hypothetical protein
MIICSELLNENETNGNILLCATQSCEVLKANELHHKQRYMIHVLLSFDHPN